MRNFIKKSPLFCAVLSLLVLLACFSLFWPQKEVSDLENRRLAQRPALTVESIRFGSYPKMTEEALADQFPFRDGWLSVNALYGSVLLKAVRNGILIGKNNRLFEDTAQLSTKTLFDNTEALRKLKEATGVDTWLMLVPTAAGVYEESLPSFYQPLDQISLFKEAGLRSGAKIIDILPALLQNKDENLYYRSDHHWNAAGARLAYETLADSWGLIQRVASDRLVITDFFGTLASRLVSTFVNPDNLTFDLYEDIDLYIAQEKMDGLYNVEQMKKRDKYASLLYDSAQGILTLVNRRQSENLQGTLLIIRDSYADAILPAVATHFQKVIAIDLRTWQGDIVALCKQEGAECILCLYGLSTWLTDRSLPAAATDSTL